LQRAGYFGVMRVCVKSTRVQALWPLKDYSMNIGKLKINNAGIFSSKWDFYEYARHSIRWSMGSVKTLMTKIGGNSVLHDVPYVKTDNLYIQLLAAYTASYWHYLYFTQIVPHELLNHSMAELKRGLDDGIKAITIGPNKIDTYFVKLYHYSFRRYLRGVMDDCSKIDDIDPNVFNPDINNFTQAFMEDVRQLSLQSNQEEMEELKLYLLSQIAADIPLSVFESLSKMTIQYLPPKKGFF
jgi:hypothetical protein